MLNVKMTSKSIECENSGAEGKVINVWKTCNFFSGDVEITHLYILKLSEYNFFSTIGVCHLIQQM